MYNSGLGYTLDTVLQKAKSLSFDLEPPTHREFELRIFHATTDFCQISSRSVNIWKNGGRKKLFLAYNRGRPCIQDTAVDEALCEDWL